MISSRRAWLALLVVLLAVPAPVSAGVPEDTVGLVDPGQGLWYLQAEDGGVRSFFYGNPDDAPFVGDWDCDGVDTPGLYRQSDGFAYLRNSNTQGVADLEFFFGNPGDEPIPGDFDGDGCDSLSIYRPSEQRFYIINELGEDGGGLGAADYTFDFGNPGDTPIVGDFDADGFDEVGLYRESTGFVYYEDALVFDGGGGAADHEFFFGNPEDRFVAGDWTGDGTQTVGVFRPSDSTFYLRYSNTQGNADEERRWGDPGWLPVAGSFDLPAGLPDPPAPPDCLVFSANSCLKGLALTLVGGVPGGDAAGVAIPLPGTSDMLVVGQSGVVWRFDPTGNAPMSVHLDIRNRVRSGGEEGLLGLATHPDYLENGLLYVDYTNAAGNIVVAEFDGAAERVLLEVPHPGQSNHNGGMLAFGPDGYLYIATGDGGGGGDPDGNGQDPSTLLGAILRIDVDGGVPYAIPLSNPFVGGGGAPEVWAYGLRNPWRMSFDGSDLYIGDVGQGAREEIDVITVADGGANFGWAELEGTLCYPGGSECDPTGTVLPVVEYPTRVGGTCSVIGGYVYRGSAIPELTGRYLYSDFCAGWIRSFVLDGGAATDEVELRPAGALFAGSFGFDGSGELYVTTTGGSIYRIDPVR